MADNGIGWEVQEYVSLEGWTRTSLHTKVYEEKEDAQKIVELLSTYYDCEFRVYEVLNS